MFWMGLRMRPDRLVCGWGRISSGGPFSFAALFSRDAGRPLSSASSSVLSLSSTSIVIRCGDKGAVGGAAPVLLVFSRCPVLAGASLGKAWLAEVPSGTLAGVDCARIKMRRSLESSSVWRHCVAGMTGVIVSGMIPPSYYVLSA